MPRKPKFKPVITRIKLNPEQAVLQCQCWQDGMYTGYDWRFRSWGTHPCCQGKETAHHHSCQGHGGTLWAKGTIIAGAAFS